MLHFITIFRHLFPRILKYRITFHWEACYFLWSFGYSFCCLNFWAKFLYPTTHWAKPLICLIFMTPKFEFLLSPLCKIYLSFLSQLRLFGKTIEIRFAFLSSLLKKESSSKSNIISYVSIRIFQKQKTMITPHFR